jgi:Protein of unknown function (DUF2971)
MWSHYARDHTGFVIGFDTSHQYFQKKEHRGLWKVQYQDVRPEFSMELCPAVA